MASTQLPASRTPPTHAGALIREWRTARRMSQLDLSLEAEVSARHLSCLETGKASPSREMIGRLAEVLEIPLRECNSLLVAAGFAPNFRESPLSAAELKPVRRAIEFIVNQQEPYPALVMNRYWDVVMNNGASERLYGFLRDGGSAHANLLRQVFDPDDIRPAIVNWEEVAGELVRHLHHDVAATPTDEHARALLEEVLSSPDVPTRWRARDLEAQPLPLLTTAFARDGVELRFFSTITTFGTVRDITLDELRIECLFPANDQTTEFCRELARRDG